MPTSLGPNPARTRKYKPEPGPNPKTNLKPKSSPKNPKVKLGLKNLAMLPSYFDYIFVSRRLESNLRPESSPKFLSTLGPNPTRKARPELQLWADLIIIIMSPTTKSNLPLYSLYYAVACNEFGGIISTSLRLRGTQLPSKKYDNGNEPLATLSPIWPFRDLNLRPPAPKMNALPLDQLVGKSK